MDLLQERTIVRECLSQALRGLRISKVLPEDDIATFELYAMTAGVEHLVLTMRRYPMYGFPTPGEYRARVHSILAELILQRSDLYAEA